MVELSEVALDTKNRQLQDEQVQGGESVVRGRVGEVVPLAHLATGGYIIKIRKINRTMMVIWTPTSPAFLLLTLSSLGQAVILWPRPPQ